MMFKTIADAMLQKQILVSFSGGKTSAYMSYLIKQSFANTHDCKFIFANTGFENEETLEFVNKCDIEFGLNLIWVEAKVNPLNGKGIRHNIVDFKSASRNGEPFENFIRKSGIPNATYPQCSDRLKLMPIEHWKKSNGYSGVMHAIGIRIDEIRRLSKTPQKYNLVYPLAHWWPSDKQDINSFFENFKFNLNLLEHEGNCKTCWKKSDKKLFAIALDNPEKFDFFKKMEIYKMVKPNRDKSPRLFFRGHRTVDQMLEQAKLFDRQRLSKFLKNRSDDDDSGCSESCEAY